MRSHRSLHSSPNRKLRLLLPLAGALVLLACLALPALAQATTVTWTQGSINYPNPNNMWTDPRNWSPEQVPGPDDHVVIDTLSCPSLLPAGGTFQGIEVQCQGFVWPGDLTLTQGTSVFGARSYDVQGTLTNYAASTIIIEGDYDNVLGTDTVVNYGTIIGRQTESFPTPSLGSPVYNYGTVTCDAGTFWLYQGGIGYPGSTIGGGAGIVQLAAGSGGLSGWSLEDGCELAGGVELHAATTIPAGATVTCQGSDSVVLGGGLSGPGTLRVQPGSTLALSNYGGFSAGLTLDNDGTVVVNTGTGHQWQGGTLFDNSGVLDLQSNYGGLTADTSAGRASLHNSGTITSEGINPYIELALDNSGMISVPSGSLRLIGGTSAPATGEFVGSGSGRVNFQSMTYELADGVRLQNVDIVSSPSSPTLVVGPSATVTMEGANTIGGAARVEGPGTLRLAPEATLTGYGAFAGGLHFDVEGTLALTYTSTWDAGTVLDNSGTVDLLDRDINAGVGGPGTIVNTGTVTKSAASGVSVSTIALPLDNRGTVRAGAGTLRLAGGTSAPATGSFVSSGGALMFAGASLFELGDGATLTGTTPDQNGEKLAVVAGATATFEGSTSLHGTLSGPGTARVPPDATVTVTGDYNYFDGVQLDVEGTFALASFATVYGGSVIDNSGTFYVLYHARLLSDAANGPGSLLNRGTIIRTDSMGGGAASRSARAAAPPIPKGWMGNESISVPIDNQGTVRVMTGVLELTPGILLNYNAATKTLTGGTYEAVSSGILRIDDADVATLAASVGPLRCCGQDRGLRGAQRPAQPCRRQPRLAA